MGDAGGTSSEQRGRDALADIPFLKHLGAELVHWENGCAEIALDPLPEHGNSLSMAHGGIVMTLLDVAMARAARTSAAGGAITVEMKTSFMRPARGRLLARGRELSRSRSLVYCEAELFGGDGQLVAKAMGTFKLIDRTQAAGRL
jgi:uncharacterized protein (TIGR00369 family)